MREEEEKMAEEEDVDDSLLTYDRPDLCNKVTLRRSSTGMWEVCSSGQNLDNDNSVLGGPKKKRMSEKSDKKVEFGGSENMEGDTNKRTLRSARCEAQVNSISTLDKVKVRGCHQNDNSSIKHRKATRSSHKACSEDPSIVMALPVSQCSTDGLAYGDSLNESRTLPAKSLRKSNSLHNNCSSPADDTSTLDCSVESLTNNVSPVNHKYATRQKVTLHDAK